jgi:phospholipid/cholesterol/gamma-HCH transport system permease protein
MRTSIEDMLEGVGQVSANLAQSFQYIFKRQVNLAATFQQIALIGFDSIPIALIISFIAGSVLALHAAEKFAMTGANAYVGSLVAIAMVREMAPIFTALAMGARAGTAISAEIANMNVTNQIDALKIMHINPIRYLMVPRVLACVISLPLITILSEGVGIIGGMYTSRYSAQIHPSMFLDSVHQGLKWHDIEVSLIKALIFGLILAGVSVTTGLNTRGGAKNVGLATTQATVWTAICVLIADFFLTWIFFGTSYSG